MEQENTIDVGGDNSRLPKFSYYLLIATSFLLPIFFVPTFSIALSKVTLISLVTLVLTLVWLFSKLKEGKITFQKNLFALSAVIIPVVFTLSALLSGTVKQSFLGNGFEIGTALSVVFGFILLFLVSSILRARERILVFYFTFFLTFFIVALYQAIRLLGGPDLLSFGVFTDVASNLVGKWNELGIFFGLSALVSLITFEFLPVSKVFKILSGVALVISLLFLLVINFSYVLWVLAVLSFISCVYWLAVNRKREVIMNEGGETKTSRFAFLKKNAISIPSLVVFVFCLVAIFGGAWIQGKFPQKLQIQQIEVSPSWTYTYDISKATLKHDPLFGAGPNNFTEQWFGNKPAEVNQTMFWNVDFGYGIGLIPTYLVTTGLLGFLAWLFFLGALITLGVRVLFTQTQDLVGRYILFSSFFAALYLWIFQIIYVPSQVIFSLAFVFTGVFIAGLIAQKEVRLKSFVFGNEPKLNFFSSLAIIVLLLGALSLVYLMGSKTVAAGYFFKGIALINEKGDIQSGEALLKKAIAIDNNNDVYYRTLTDIGVAKINAVLSQPDAKQDQVKAQFEAIFPDVLDQVQKAITVNPTNYQNWLVLGRIYSGVLPLGYPGAYDKAKEAYNQALVINPASPLITLELARLEVLNNAPEKAKEYIGQAIKLKPNYTEAVYLLSQIEIAAGNIKGAIDSVGAAAFLTPNDPTIFFQLGFLLYSDKNYKDAVAALERSVQLNNDYSNARYFLGLSYDKLGKSAEALAQFVRIQELNPDNKEVEAIIVNLKAGRDPFATAKVEKPEKRKTLPVKEKTAN